MPATDEPRQLTEEMVADAAEDAALSRGEDYLRYVRGLRVVGATANATIQARRVYLVGLDWSDGSLRGDCTCPHAASGAFCKHQVAVALSVVDTAALVRTPAAEDDAARPLDALPEDALRDLVAELMERDPAVARLVELRAASYSGYTEGSAELLVADVDEVLSSRGFVDYRRSFEVAQDAQDLLDLLEQHLDVGRPDTARPALLRVTKRLQKLILHADDSGGVIGDACQRALDLYARACREGHPDGNKLARWLAKFRDESPGWPSTELADFVAAFDDKALTTYRRAVDRLVEKHRDSDRWERLELDRMRLELADHDGDVDRAVEILSAGEHPSYGAIVDRLQAAGRHDEALSWTDAAVAAGRVSGQGGGNDYWLAPRAVADAYLAADRADDAVAVLRGEFRRAAGAATFRQLVDFATPLGRAESELAWALTAERELAGRADGSGAALVDITLREGDLEAAWEAAREYGPGHLWQPLAEASATSRPREAAELYRPGLEEDLRFADTGKHAGIADRLARMQELFHAAGDDEDFAALMAALRRDYGRRPSLMAALDRRRLP